MPDETTRYCRCGVPIVGDTAFIAVFIGPGSIRLQACCAHRPPHKLEQETLSALLASKECAEQYFLGLVNNFWAPDSITQLLIH